MFIIKVLLSCGSCGRYMDPIQVCWLGSDSIVVFFMRILPSLSVRVFSSTLSIR